MFANRYTALVDACSPVDTMRRDLLLTLAGAEFFRVRWSVPIMEETERAITWLAEDKGYDDAEARGARARLAMERAFEEASVTDFEPFMPVAASLPDQGDHHVLAAALKIQAQTIITQNLRDFPLEILASLGIEARSAHDFIAAWTLAAQFPRYDGCARGSGCRGWRPIVCCSIWKREG